MIQESFSKEEFYRIVKELQKIGVELRQYYHDFLPLFPQLYSYDSWFDPAYLKEYIQRQSIKGLYIHVPFCQNFCCYCPYYKEKFLTEKQLDEYLNLLQQEIKLFRENFIPSKKLNIQSVYIGGGTPSLFTNQQVKKLFSIIEKYFTINPKAEVTFEMNLASTTPSKLLYLKSVGVNRVSIGIQTFDGNLLAKLGRGYTADYIRPSIGLIQKHFSNYNIDMMFGLPYQQLEMLKKDLDVLKKIDPPSVTFYQLWLKRRSCVFMKLPEYSKISASAFPSIKTIINMKYLLWKFLKEGHYQIKIFPWFLKSTFSHPHQQMMYKSETVIGFGPAAYSEGKHWGYGNVPTLKIYREKIEKGNLPICSGIILTPVEQALRNLLLGLKCGVVSINEDLLKCPLTENILDKIEKLRHAGVIFRNGNNLQLTSIGKFFVDEINFYLMPKIYHPRYCEHVCVHANSVWTRGKWKKYVN
ncbi:MAG: coproporphyrinogen III oxidase family protein [Bacteroidales bacterium]|jgi:oxygen-independent coproporphyrinogen-3 oxidase|nr:coproporphyrinogen III oxidase family protein [Bacteroidales bacterium]